MISIIIPTKNEPFIQNLVDKIHSELDTKHEIIVVDKSKQRPDLRNVKLIIQKSDGLGNAFLEGLDKSIGKIIVLMDGDGSHDPKDIKKLITPLKKYDMVWGSKRIRGAKTEDSFLRHIVSMCFSLITCLILQIRIKDPMSGFAAYRRDVLECVREELTPRGFKINLEIYFKAHPKTLEVPITFHKRQAGKSTVGWSISGIKEALRILILIYELKLGRIMGEW